MKIFLQEPVGESKSKEVQAGKNHADHPVEPPLSIVDEVGVPIGSRICSFRKFMTE